MPRKRRDAGVELSGTDSAPVQINVGSDRLSPLDRLAVEILLEVVASRGTSSATFAKSAADSAKEMAKELGWK